MRLYPERVVIVAEQRVVAEPALAVDRDHVDHGWQDYFQLVERKPGALRDGAPFTTKRLVYLSDKRQSA